MTSHGCDETLHLFTAGRTWLRWPGLACAVAVFSAACGPTNDSADSEAGRSRTDGLTYSTVRFIAVALMGRTETPTTCLDGTQGVAWKRYVVMSAQAGNINDKGAANETALDIQTGVCDDSSIDTLIYADATAVFTMTSVNSARIQATFATPEGLLSADLQLTATEAMQTQSVKYNDKWLPDFHNLFRYSERIRLGKVSGSATIAGIELLTVSPASNEAYLDYTRETYNYVGSSP